MGIHKRTPPPPPHELSLQGMQILLATNLFLMDALQSGGYLPFRQKEGLWILKSRHHHHHLCQSSSEHRASPGEERLQKAFRTSRQQGDAHQDATVDRSARCSRQNTTLSSDEMIIQLAGLKQTYKKDSCGVETFN